MNLQDLCLKTIVDEFDRYYEAYSTSEDENIKRLFEFLQRKYAFQLITRLYAHHEVEEKYVDLLINKYLKVLDTDWFRNCSWKTVTTKFAEIGHNIEKIYFHDVYFEGFSEEAPWQDVICYLPNIEFLSFHADCNDEVLKSVAKFCPNIVEIDIRNSCITNEGIKQLCIKENGKSCCPKLKKILIASTAVKEEGMKYLIKNLPSLEQTDYPELPQVIYALHVDDLLSLDRVQPYNIISLDLLNFALTPYFSELLKICLYVCPRLKSLTCPLLSAEHLNTFSELSDLEKLHLECYSNSEIDVNNILESKGSKLTSLTILNCIVSISTLAKCCPRLKQLCLNKVSFLLHDCEYKLGFHSLDSCTFESITYDPTTAKGVSILLSSSPKLEYLAFKRCTLLSSEMKEHILKCFEHASIKKISFSGSAIEKDFVKKILMNCHTLKCMNLDGCDFEPDDEDEMARFSEVQPNAPEVYFSEQLSISDYDEFLNDFYDYDDELDDDYDDYDDEDDYFTDQYDDEDDYDDYGYYFAV